MPFPSLDIQLVAPPAAGLSSRADGALFAGLVGRRETPLPASLRDWLERAGWAGSGPFARDAAAVAGVAWARIGRAHDFAFGY